MGIDRIDTLVGRFDAEGSEEYAFSSGQGDGVLDWKPRHASMAEVAEPVGR